MPQSRYVQLDGSIKEVLARVGEQSTSLAVLTEHVKNIDASMAVYAQAKKEQNGRVGKLEGKVWWIIGLGTATAATVGVFLVRILDKVMQ